MLRLTELRFNFRIDAKLCEIVAEVAKREQP